MFLTQKQSGVLRVELNKLTEREVGAIYKNRNHSDLGKLILRNLITICIKSENLNKKNRKETICVPRYVSIICYYSISNLVI